MRFEVLGAVRVLSDDGRLLPTASKARILLSTLVLGSGSVVSIGRLIDAMWGEALPREPRTSVQVWVSRLRKQFAIAGVSREVISTEPTGYRIDVESNSVDLLEFRVSCGHGRTAAASGRADEARAWYRAALEIWRGEALVDVDSDIVRQAAETLEEERIQIHEECMECELALGGAGYLVAELTDLVRRYPYRERLQAALMVALYRAGRQGEALTAYREARQLLRDELGAEPGSDLKHVHRAILRSDPWLDPPRVVPSGRSTAIPVPRELPADVAAFTGRTSALEELSRVTSESQHPLMLLITGTAGVGKSALAIHWAHQAADRFPEGQLYVNLRGFSAAPPLSPIEALTAALHSLGTPPDQTPVDEVSAAKLYRSILAGRRVLVILDNAEAVDQVRPMFPGAPGCLVLATSRERLSGLVVHDGAHRCSLGVLTQEEACELLTRLLGTDRVNAEAEAAADLARTCAYLPLALRVAVATLVDHPHRAISAYVDDLHRTDLLTALRVQGDEENAVRATLGLSYQRVPAEVQWLFRVLGLLPGPTFTPPAAAAIAGIAVDQAKQLLDRLGGSHLVEEVGPDRYAFHDLLRLYAGQLVHAENSADERTAAVQRLFDWYIQATTVAGDHLYPEMLRLPPAKIEQGSSLRAATDASDATAWLHAEQANLVAAVQHGADHGPRLSACLLADRLRGYFWRTQHKVDWLMVASAAAKAAKDEGELKAQAAAQLSLADLYQNLGRHSESNDCYASALDLAQQSGWDEGQAAALGNIGIVRWSRGQLSKAAEYFTEALHRNRRAGRRGAQATNSDNLGIVSRELGRLDDAARYHTEAVSLHQELGSVSGEAIALNNLGCAEHERGLLDQAREHLCRALQLHKQVGSGPGMVTALAGLADMYSDAGELSTAIEHATASHTLAGTFESTRHEVGSLNALGNAELYGGEYQRALEHYQSALDLVRPIGYRLFEVEALLGLARAQHSLGRSAMASQSAERALQYAEEVGYHVRMAQALSVLADIRLSQQRYHDAAEYAQRGLAGHRATGSRLGEARTIATLGDIVDCLEGPDAARSHRVSARDVFVELGAPVPQNLAARLQPLIE